jgi:hypothetical protein
MRRLRAWHSIPRVRKLNLTLYRLLRILSLALCFSHEFLVVSHAGTHPAGPDLSRIRDWPRPDPDSNAEPVTMFGGGIGEPVTLLTRLAGLRGVTRCRSMGSGRMGVIMSARMNLAPYLDAATASLALYSSSAEVEPGTLSLAADTEPGTLFQPRVFGGSPCRHPPCGSRSFTHKGLAQARCGFQC